MADVSSNVAVAPAVRVTTSSGDPVQGITVTFTVASGGGSLTGGSPSTGSDGVATLGSWTLGPNPGANTLTASITASNVTGNPATFTATGELGPFNPTGNTTLSGTKSYSTVDIPAGVTVTATSDLVLNVAGDATIAGTITGDCRAIEVNADGVLELTGAINAGCTGAIPATGAPTLTLVGKGGYTIDGATEAAGDVVITDDPTATDADFAPSLAPSARSLSRSLASRAAGSCSVLSYSNTAKPTKADDGAPDDPAGKNGKEASTFTLRCKGGADIVVGSLTLTGQHGGHGGAGTNSDATAANATGGTGGRGGNVKIQAVGAIVIGGGTINTGNGGNGGAATATGTGGGGNSGASATSTGGAGGSPGLFSATSANASVSIQGPLTINIGMGGRGGDATSTGADGHNAPACPAATGGAATATAGAGGSTPDKQLTGNSGVSGLANVTVTGGTPGDGGDATATAGKGGDGDQPCKPGADGGNPTATGGKGGDADLKNRDGDKIANGGNGGSMTVMRALGGLGFIDCVNAPFEAGGPGGKGGTVGGANGLGGTGLANGADGGAIFNLVANGGNGGNGIPPGDSGARGTNAATLTVAPTINDPSFMPGIKGTACPGFTMAVAPATQTVTQGSSGSVTVTIVRTGSFAGAVNLEVKDEGGTVRGTGTIAAGNTAAGVTFSVPSAEPLGSRTWSVVGMDTNVPSQTAPFGLDVVAVPAIDEVVLDLTSTTPPLTPGVVGPGTFTGDLLDAVSSAVAGAMDFIAEGPSGSTFYGNDAPSGGSRLGWEGGVGSWLFDLASAVVNGVQFAFETFEVCIINSSVDASNPVEIEELDDMDMTTATTAVTDISSCTEVTLQPTTKKVRVKKSGKGKFADGRRFGGKRKKGGS